MQTCLRLLAAGILATGLSAQQPTYVIPDGTAKTEGNSSHHIPGYYGPNRVQSIYHSSVLTGLPTGNISTLHVRRNGTSTGTFVAHTWNVTLHMASKGVPNPANASDTSYAANQGSDWTMVLNNQPVNWPVPSTGSPAPFEVMIPITPFSYSSGNNLLVQWDCKPTTSGNVANYWYVDAQSYSTGSGGTFTKYGTGCPSGRTFVGSTPGGSGGAMYWYYYSGAGFSKPCVAIMGLSDTMWGSTPLPLKLDFINGNGCSLFTDPTLMWPGMTDASGTNGRYRVDLTVPPLKGLPGATVYVQTIVLGDDAPINPLGMRASEGGKATFGSLPPPLGARHLYSYDSGSSTGNITDDPQYNSNVGVVLGIN